MGKKKSLILGAGALASGYTIYGAYEKKGIDGAIAQATGIRQGEAGSGYDLELVKTTYKPMGYAMAGKFLADKLKLNRLFNKIPFISDFDIEL